MLRVIYGACLWFISLTSGGAGDRVAEVSSVGAPCLDD
jgi:hypothetical protein